MKPSLSFINGGTGGSSPTSIGGFGGGGCGVKSGGGGGGYSGGGVEGNTTGGVAGGGGSYNIGANKQNLTFVITWIVFFSSLITVSVVCIRTSKINGLYTDGLVLEITVALRYRIC